MSRNGKILKIKIHFNETLLFHRTAKNKNYFLFENDSAKTSKEIRIASDIKARYHGMK